LERYSRKEDRLNKIKILEQDIRAGRFYVTPPWEELVEFAGYDSVIPPAVPRAAPLP
jgi:hypothetical protein